jgi:predicted aspartyl protease
MGHVWVDAEIFDQTKNKGRKVKGLVDTGSTLTVLPESLAIELGIAPTSEEKIQTASGILTIKKGRAVIRIENKEELQPVWISEIIDKVLIGSVTLETLGLRVNPITGKIEETPLLLY